MTLKPATSLFTGTPEGVHRRQEERGAGLAQSRRQLVTSIEKTRRPGVHADLKGSGRIGVRGRCLSRRYALRPHGEERGEAARLEPWAAEGVDGRISCKQQGIYSRFTSMAASSVPARFSK